MRSAKVSTLMMQSTMDMICEFSFFFAFVNWLVPMAFVGFISSECIDGSKESESLAFQVPMGVEVYISGTLVVFVSIFMCAPEACGDTLCSHVYMNHVLCQNTIVYRNQVV